MIKRPPAQVDLRPYYKGEESGHARKTLFVLHETVSPNYVGLWDIKNPAAYLDSKGYEIHAIIDKEANFAWCYDPTAIYDHAASGTGRVNTRSIGLELVSEIPKLKTVAQRRAAWADPSRRKQLNLAAKLIAWLTTLPDDKVAIPVKFSDATRPGVTTHWNVSQSYDVSDGHWDCWPVHLGGHFPALYVVQRARDIVALNA